MLCRPQQGSLANLQTVRVENLWSRAQHIKRFWSSQNYLWNKEYSKCTLWVLPSCLSNFCFEFSKRVNSVIGLFRWRNSNVKIFWVVRLLVAKCTCHILLLLSHLPISLLTNLLNDAYAKHPHKWYLQDMISYNLFRAIINYVTSG